MKYLRLALFVLGGIGILFCIGGKGGTSTTADETRLWFQVGLASSPIYVYERVEDGDGAMLSLSSGLHVLSYTTLLFIVSIAVLKLGLKIPKQGSGDPGTQSAPPASPEDFSGE